MTHALKTSPTYFQAVVKGEKTFEVRKSDRNFKEGDDLLLQEYDEVTGKFSGEEWKGKITFMLSDMTGYVKKGYVTFSIIPA